MPSGASPASRESLHRLVLASASPRRAALLEQIGWPADLIDAPGVDESVRVVTTIVTVKRLSGAEIDAYIESDEWRGKAGAYAIQGRAAALISSLSGSYSNVVGLALFEARQMLTGLGYRGPA